MNFRVFRAPDRASGQLLETSNHDNRGDEDEQTPFVVEAQLREGDRLHFSALFREIMREFKARRLGMRQKAMGFVHRVGLGCRWALEWKSIPCCFSP